jgi:amino acid adenylation domain-containing protein
MKNRFIGLMVDDTPALLVGLLGILKSGNTFVPVNPLFPGDRIRFIISDCNIEVLVTDCINYPRALQIARESSVIRHLICIDRLTGDVIHRHTFREDIVPSAKYQGDAQSPSYVIYTSGSTGKPKGVPISHRNLVPLLLWFCRYFQLGIHTGIMQNLSYTFDFGVFELLTTLFSGGTIYMLDKKEVGDFQFYSDFIRSNNINTIHSTPAFFSNVVAAGKRMPSLEIVHLGGENLSGGLVARISGLVSKTCRIYNGYGPTEATINCSIHPVTSEQKSGIAPGESIPIGKPSAHNKIYILDKYRRLLPIGVAGELCVAGEGLADGYLNRPELTAEKFQKTYRFYNSNSTNVFYRTGDLARWLPGGSIEYLGRIDRQVKIRGFRIELGEIENCLLKHNAIKEVVVTARQDTTGEQQYLCAYIVPSEDSLVKNLTVSELREHLSAELPDYMVPACFIELEKIPLTPNGKIDRESLPAPTQDSKIIGTEYVPPANETEYKMAGIWQEILGIQGIGREDDFFECGGNSILATRCIARIREEFNVDISLRKIFERPTVKALSKEVTTCEQEKLSIMKALRSEDIPLSFAQERLWFLQKLDSSSLAYFVPRVIRINGNLSPQLLEQTFTEIIRRHEILRTAFPCKDSRPVQRIFPPYDFKIPIIDFSNISEAAQFTEISQWIRNEGQRSFDFENGPLLRVTLLKLGRNRHIMVLTEHHLIHDGWTQGVLLREFITLYTAFLEEKPSPLPELPIQYADFAVWQRNYLQGELLEYHLNYWKEKLSGLPPLLEIPSDRPRPPVISGRGEMIPLVIPASLTAVLKEFAREEGVTLFMTMITVFKVFLYRYTGVGDLCVGTGTANRRLIEMQSMLGMVINTLALRTRLSGDISFRECLRRVKQTCLEAYEHEDTPFEKVVEALRPGRNLAFTPIFQVLFSFMDTPTESLALPGLELILEESHNRSSKFDLNIVCVPPAEQDDNVDAEILVEWEYNSDIFNSDTAERMTEQYLRLLDETAGNPGEPISSLLFMEEASTADQSFEDNLHVEFNF